MSDMNLTPLKSIRYPQIKNVFIIINLLQFITLITDFRWASAPLPQLQLETRKYLYHQILYDTTL